MHFKSLMFVVTVSALGQFMVRVPVHLALGACHYQACLSHFDNLTNDVAKATKKLHCRRGQQYAGAVCRPGLMRSRPPDGLGFGADYETAAVRLQAGPRCNATVHSRCHYRKVHQASGEPKWPRQGLPTACLVPVSYPLNPAGDTTAPDQPKHAFLGRSANVRGTLSKYRFEHDQI